MNCIEIWQEINGFENYAVSNFGNVKSIERLAPHPRARDGVALKREHLLKPFLNHKGYLMVKLYNDNQMKSIAVHRLVANAFVENPLSLPCVNHKDENKQNNCVDNLEWCTNDYNVHYGTAIKRKSKSLRESEAHKRYSERRCKRVEQTDMNGNVIKIWKSVVSVSAGGFDDSSVIACCKGRKESYKGYKWKYHNEDKTLRIEKGV